MQGVLREMVWKGGDIREMTKRTMVKKFRKETGADKKTAMDYLRKSNWEYGNAVKWFNLSKNLEAVGETMRKLGEKLRKIGETNKEESHERDENRTDKREVQGVSETGTGDSGSDGNEESQMQESDHVQRDPRILEGESWDR